MNKKQTIEALKKAGYQVKRNVFCRERVEAFNGRERVDVFFGRRTRSGKQAECAVIFSTPIFRPSDSKNGKSEIIPGTRAREHKAAKDFSKAFPELVVREGGVATTVFKAGKLLRNEPRRATVGRDVGDDRPRGEENTGRVEQ